MPKTDEIPDPALDAKLPGVTDPEKRDEELAKLEAAAAAAAELPEPTGEMILDDAGGEHVDVGGFGLPKGIDPKDLRPDPGKRPGHWWHPATDQVFCCPLGWKPK